MIAFLLKNWRLIAVALLLGALGLQTVRIANLKQAAADHRAELATATQRAEKAERAEETRRQDVVTKEDTDAQARIATLEVELVTARTAADRLRTAAANAASRARTGASASVVRPGGPSTDALDLLVTVLDRHSRELVAVGEFADRLRSAGTACERSYDGLQPADGPAAP